jgi:hypothetical protein
LRTEQILIPINFPVVSASIKSLISHPANLLVMGPGGYGFVDYNETWSAADYSCYDCCIFTFADILAAIV